MRISASLAVMTAAVLASACSVDVRGEGVRMVEEKLFPVTGPVQLSLRTFDGPIRLRSWDRNEVRIEIERRAADEAEANALEVRATQVGDRIMVEAVAPAPPRDDVRFRWNSRSVALSVTAPRQIAMDARTGDGSITVENMSGNIALYSGDGSMRAVNVEGELSLQTGDGSISARGVRGQVTASSGDGSVALSGVLQGLRVHTGDGSVNLKLDEGSAMTSDWTVTTGDGSISVGLPAAFDGELVANSGDGGVHVAGATDDSARRQDRRTFRGRLGNGGHVLHLGSGDGSITVSRR